MVSNFLHRKDLKDNVVKQMGAILHFKGCGKDTTREALKVQSTCETMQLKPFRNTFVNMHQLLGLISKKEIQRYILSISIHNYHVTCRVILDLKRKMVEEKHFKR